MQNNLRTLCQLSQMTLKRGHCEAWAQAFFILIWQKDWTRLLKGFWFFYILAFGLQLDWNSFILSASKSSHGLGHNQILSVTSSQRLQTCSCLNASLTEHSAIQRLRILGLHQEGHFLMEPTKTIFQDHKYTLWLLLSLVTYASLLFRWFVCRQDARGWMKLIDLNFWKKQILQFVNLSFFMNVVHCIFWNGGLCSNGHHAQIKCWVHHAFEHIVI